MTRLLLIALAAASVGLSGCQMGRFSLAMNKDHFVPYPTIDVLPQQWEPEIVDE